MYNRKLLAVLFNGRQTEIIVKQLSCAVRHKLIIPQTSVCVCVCVFMLEEVLSHDLIYLA